MATKANRSKATRSAIARGSLTVLDDARGAGLLDGGKTEHVSFRAPGALVETARREIGINSPTEPARFERRSAERISLAHSHRNPVMAS